MNKYVIKDFSKLNLNGGKLVNVSNSFITNLKNPFL